jgi:hypothetical protein
MSICIGIIGTSGRHGDLTKETFEQSLNFIDNYIQSLKIPKENITLVSGGSSGIDHIAVMLYLQGKCGSLRVHLPCPMDTKSDRFTFTCKYDRSACDTLNAIHEDFGKMIGADTMKQLCSIHNDNKCTITTSLGFFRRNDVVAKESQLLIAVSKGNNSPSDGGTRYTWNKNEGSKVFIRL